MEQVTHLTGLLQPGAEPYSHLHRKGDTAHQSPNLEYRKDDMTGQELDARAQEILAADGIYDPTQEQYIAALEAAQAEIPEEAKTAVYTGDPGGEALHLTAMQVLEKRGKRFEHTVDDYLSAIDEAAGILSIDLSGRGR
jgi:hypothetical protein